MTDETVLMIAVEPPLNVGNSLLEAIRRLAGEMAARGMSPTWVPPDMYAAPIVTLSPDSPEARLFATPRIHTVVYGQEELAVQLMPLTVESVGEGMFAVMARLTAQNDALKDLAERLVREFSDTALTVAVRPPFGIMVALLASESVTAAVRELLPDGRNVPIAGWLLGGVHLMTATWRKDERQYDVARLRHHPFRRLGSRSV